MPTPTVVAPVPDSPPPLWGLLRPVVAPSTNHSAPSPATSSSNALVPSTFKELALAMLNPAPVVATSSAGSRQASSTPAPSALTNDGPSECSCGCGLITWPGIGKTKPSTDLVVRTTAASLAITPDKNVKAGLSIFSPNPKIVEQTQTKGKGKASVVKDESLYALSTRIVGSLSEYLDWTFGAVPTEVAKDIQEIMDAIDDLVHAIRQQTEFVWAQSLDTAKGVRAHLRERHNRAKRNAKKLKALGEMFLASVGQRIQERHGHASVAARKLGEMGGQLFSTLGEHMRERLDVARKNARALREGKNIWEGRQKRQEARRLRWASFQ